MLLFSLFLCLILVALLSASEGFLAATNRVRLQQWLQMRTGSSPHSDDADEVVGLSDDTQRFIATVTIAASVPFLAAAALCAHWFLARFGASAGAFAVCVALGLAVVAVFQMAPRALVSRGGRTSEGREESARGAWWFLPARVLVAFLRPPVALLMFLGALLLRLLGMAQSSTRWRETSARSDERSEENDEEIRDLVESAHDAGALEDDGRELLESIFSFGDTRVSEIMVPRPDIFALPLESAPEWVLDALQSSGFSRVPIFQNDLDHIAGVLHVKDILGLWANGTRDFRVESAMRPALYVPETQKIDEALARMQRAKTHLALVMDEFGGVAGLLTVEDILEELVGDIADEHDKREAAPLQILDEHSAIADALLHIEELRELWNLSLPTGEFDSVGGWMIEQLGRALVVGDCVEAPGATLTVHSMRGRRPHKIFIVRH